MTDAINENQDYDVSDTWERRFDTFKELGVDELGYMKAMKGDKVKALSFSERNKVLLNVWALVFGPFYYIAKKMYFKGAFILGASWLFSALLGMVESFVGINLPSVIFWIVPGLFCMQAANVDYYKFVTQEEKIWPQLPEFFSTVAGAVAFPVAAFSIILLSAALSTGGVPSCSDSETKGLVKQIILEQLAKVIPANKMASMQFSMDAIRTTATDAQTGANACAADITLLGDVNDVNGHPITYTVESTDDGRTYVNVYGL